MRDMKNVSFILTTDTNRVILKLYPVPTQQKNDTEERKHLPGEGGEKVNRKGGTAWN